jgi:cytosine/adenosine deaminase-related metal-dependent hydrolase
VSAGVRSSLERVVSGEATGQLAAVRARRDAVAGTGVLPWHRDLRAARTAYVAYLDVRLRYLTAVGADLDALYAPHPELGQALERAREAFGRAAGARGRAVLVLPER